ncbi:MAG: adenylate/guanylate cyclase domain-containing protein [Thiotrichaceae bacterium]|nr:adenylate/guanylate cyclase domain-containing protein [Thiotrichaceae bacterium]
MMKWLKSASFIALGVGASIWLMVFGLNVAGFLEPLELASYDRLLWTRLQHTPQKIDPRIVIVWFTDQDQRRFGYPITDADLSLVFENILEQQPRVVGLDLYRDFPVPLQGGAGYEHLKNLYSHHKNLIAIRKVENIQGERGVKAPAFINDQNQVGFNDLPSDKNGTVRRSLFYIQDSQEQILDYFGFRLAVNYLASQGIHVTADPKNPEAIYFGKVHLAPLSLGFGGYSTEEVAAGIQLMLSYPAAPQEFAHLSISDIIDHKIPANFFTDKIVIIGTNAEATPDFLYPAISQFLPLEKPSFAGASVHAYVTSQLLQLAQGEAQLLRSLSTHEEILWIGFWAMAGALLCLWIPNLWFFVPVVLTGMFAIFGIVYTAFLHDLWIVVIAPLLSWGLASVAMIIYLSYQESQQRFELMQIFSKHVSKNVAEVMWQEREQYLNAGRLRSQRLVATVLFTDLQNFTTLSEDMEAQALMDWLNQYMASMVDLVEQHHGHVNKFIGDAIMAVFGVPIPSTTPEAIAQDAVNAVDCALAMRAAMERLQAQWKAQGLPCVRMRVGIFTGALIAGSLGGIKRQEYTVIGDTVNTASRLESFDKSVDTDSPCRVLIGDATLHYLGNQFVTDCVGEVALKGKHSHIVIHRVLSRTAV